METNLKPYEEYKKAKQSWLEKIPTHWSEAKSKRLFIETSIKNHQYEQLLSATQSQGVIPRSLLKTRVVMPTGNLDTFKLVKEGNFVISLRSFQGGLEYSKYRGIVSPAYNILEERTNQNQQYYKYLFKSHVFIGELQRNVTGIRQGKNIDVNDFKEIVLPIPPLEEQDKIVTYLDYQLVKINKFIKDKKKLISVLKEQKQAVINEAVTKGINQNVKLKSSGIEWVQDIPEHWEITRNKNLLSLRKETVGENHVNYKLLSLTTNGIIPRDLDNGKGKFPSDFSTYQKVYVNDLVFCLFDIDETPRTIGLSNLTGMITGAYTVFKARQSKDYLYYYYLSLDQKKALKPLYTGLRKVISTDRFLRVKVPLPPLEEQIEIVSFIKESISKIDSTISNTQREIDLIIEYKNRLISDVVTGKVDVRHIMFDNNVNEVDFEEVNEEVIEMEEVLEGEECEV
ncbi:restriction endonuclease subunit S [Exiguobacterium sp. s183]|uniref:restriction endonuclease subunit S n=1 Tax=Exiguobacterium sp. s183 TaxID=2751262 RepID=UPI001BE951BA|nr:restriction endonuclease subunit S [Exiguobacterium sp. s183]